MLSPFFRNSIDKGDIPDTLKEAFVIPVHKGGSKIETEQYRPISLTSHLMKAGERVLRKSIVNFLEFNKKYYPNQHGSRANESMLSQLLVHQDMILKALENHENIDSIYLDFMKAFHKMDHGILHHKLRQLGITGKIGRWIHNFLQNRKQKVLVKGKTSNVPTLTSGVPQGTVLGPLLFLIFIGDIAEGIDCKVLVYVDDSKMASRVTSEKDLEALQKDLDKVYDWQVKNNMKFDNKTFQTLRYGKYNDLKENMIYFTENIETVIDEVSSCKDLSVTMSDDGSFDEYIKKTTLKARSKCG